MSGQTPAPNGLSAWVSAIWNSGIANLRKPAGQRHLELVETLSLGGRRQLMLVRCGADDVLIGAGADAITSVTVIDRKGAAR